MKMDTYMPSAPLRPFIKAYKIIESGDEQTNRVVPDTSFALAFRLKGQISAISEELKTTLPAATFSGLRKSVRLFNYAAQTSALIVQFEETGVPAFFKPPLHELFEQSTSLDNFFPGLEISIVEERLSAAPDNLAKVAIVEQFLYNKLCCNKPDKLVLEAINKIHSNNGIIRIKELAKSLYISNDAFEKRFRRAVGATPKQFSSIIKLKAIIGQNPGAGSFTAIAFEHGYYDQPHFNKDFKLFTGQTPTEFFSSGLYW